MDHPTSGAHADAHPDLRDPLEGGKTLVVDRARRHADAARRSRGRRERGHVALQPLPTFWSVTNAPDTLKCQHTFKLTRGHCLYSDMGRIFCSIVEDTAGWHDTVCGNSNRALVQQRWGLKSYQQCRNDWHQNGHDAFLVEGGKYGLGRRDLAANVNWFSKVSAEETGVLSFDPQASRKGAFVDLRFEMDTLVLLHTCPHPLNPAAAYPKSPVAVELRRAPAVQADDFCLNACAENVRGFSEHRALSAIWLSPG